MELSREELVRQLHDRQGGFDRAVMVLKNTLQSIGSHVMLLCVVVSIIL